MHSILAAGVAALLTNVAYGTLTFSTEAAFPIDKCISLSSAGNSVIYRCSNESIWEYRYTGTSACTGIPSSAIPYAGCDDSTNRVYKIENCAAAQQKSALGSCNYYTDDSIDVYAVDVCINDDTTTSYMYKCYGSELYALTWNSDVDCPSSVNPINSSVISGSYVCGANDCHASYLRYSKSSSDVCNYDGSNYEPPNGDTYEDTNCNYIVMGNGQQPYAIGVCMASMQGYYKTSSKFTCLELSDNNWIVELWQWLDTDDCTGDEFKYLVSNYTSANYTFKCGESKCGNVIRTYSDCDSSLKTHRPEYVDTTVVFDQCLQYYHDPNTNTDDDTFYQDYYYMYSCIGNYLGVYYYLDSECTDMDTFAVTNTSALTCPTIIEGCSSPGVSVNVNGFFGVIVACFIVVMKMLW